MQIWEDCNSIFRDHLAVSHFPHHLISTFHLIVNLFQLIIFVNLNKTRSPNALLLHFKRFIVTQEVKAEKTSGQNSDQNDNKSADPPRMEMILRKNEVWQCVFSPIINHPYCVVHPPLTPLFESSSIQAKIPLEESLSISPFVGKKVEESPPSIYYHLRSVVHHVGSTANSGHYITCGKRFICGENTTGPREIEEQWMIFNDREGTKTSVNHVTDDERNQRNCYMAIYELAEVNATVETDVDDKDDNRIAKEKEMKVDVFVGNSSCHTKLANPVDGEGGIAVVDIPESTHASQQQALKEAESNAAESVAAVQQNTDKDSVQTPVER